MVIHWDDLWERFKEVMAEFRGQKIGMVGLGIIIMMVLLGIFAPVIAPDTNGEWANMNRWQDNPRNAQPVWMDYLLPGDRARHKINNDIISDGNESAGIVTINDYHMNYTMDYDVPPDDIYISLIGEMDNVTYTPGIEVSITRPDGHTFSGLISSSLSSGTTKFNKRYYIGRNMDIRDDVYNWAKPYAEGAEGLTVSNLRVSPSTISPGESVQITAKLQNFASDANSTTLSVDGETIETYTVAGGESKIINKVHTFENQGSYKIQLGTKTWTVSVIPSDQISTDLQVKNLEVKEYANIGEKVQIKYSVNNTGESELEDSVYIGGHKIENFTLAPGEERENVTTSYKFKESGTYPVRVGDKTKFVFVYIKGIPTPEDTDPIETIFGKTNSNILSDPDPLKGEYKISFTIIGDNVELDKNSRVVFAGQVYGLMGTDNMGHDIAKAWVWGARYALIIGGSIAILTVVIGTLYGMTSAYFGGWVDELMQRLNEIILGINSFIIVILVMYLWKKSMWVFVAVYGALTWRGIAKIIRSRGLQIRQDTYIEAAESLGSSGGRIIRKHMIPQIMPYSVAEAALMVPLFVMTEAGLSVLGLGDPEIVTWGRLLSEAREPAMAGGLWWWVLMPGIGLILLGFGFIASGMAIEKVVNPKMRQR